MSDSHWCEEKRDGEIEVTTDTGDIDGAIKKNMAVQFYVLSSRAEFFLHNKDSDRKYWITERNGDRIGMVTPLFRPSHRLPTVAMDYIAFMWKDRHGDFYRPGIGPIGEST